MGAKDDGSAQVGTKHETDTGSLKIFAAQVGGQRLQVARTVTGLSGLSKRFFVDIGGIDFHPLPEALKAQCLGEPNGQSVGFFARGAASAPDSNGLVRLLASDKLRDDFVCEAIPGSRIAEKACNINEDGVEEL